MAPLVPRARVSLTRFPGVFARNKKAENAFADQLRRTLCDQIRILIATVLASIATLQLPHRPDWIEPRAKKRRPKNLPLLTVPRHIARELIYTSIGNSGVQRLKQRAPHLRPMFLNLLERRTLFFSCLPHIDGCSGAS